MALTKYTPQNNAQGQLLAGISAGAGTLILQSGQGGRFPSVYPYLLEIKQLDTVAPYAVVKREIVRVTNRVGDTLTIVRSAGTCLPDDSSNTPGTTAFAFSASDIVTLTVTAETIKDLQDEMLLKLNAAAWLRTGFGTNAHVRVNLSTGAEEIKSVSAVSSIASIDKLRVEDGSTGNYKDAPYSTILNDIISSSSRIITGITAETLTAFDFVWKETLPIFIHSALWGISFNNSTDGWIWSVAGNTRRSLRVIWNGVAFTTFKLSLNKVWSPTDNFTVRFETDSSGSPSGTAVTNWTANIAGTWVVAGGTTDVTGTCAGSVTLTDWVIYHVVFSRQNAVDPANYYYFAGIQKNVRWFTQRVHNGTSWGSAVTTRVPYFDCSGIYMTHIVKVNATNREQSYYMWYTASAVSEWWVVNINQWGISKSFSWLTKNTPYYLSNTAWIISSTPGTNVRQIGYTGNDTTNLIIFLPEQNATLYDQLNSTFETIYNSASALVWRAEIATTIVVWGTLSQYWINWVSRVSGTAYQVVPWDIVTAFPSSWNVTLQILQRQMPVGNFFV